MNIIQIFDKWSKNQVIETEEILKDERIKTIMDNNNYGNFVKTPEFKFYSEAIKDMNKIDLSIERMDNSSRSGSFNILFSISVITLGVSLFLVIFFQKWFSVITILIFLIIWQIYNIYHKFMALKAEVIRYENSLNTKLKNEHNKFRENT